MSGLFSVFHSGNFVDLGLIQFGWEKSAPSKSFVARNHFLFHYILSGKGMLMANSRNGCATARPGIFSKGEARKCR